MNLRSTTILHQGRPRWKASRFHRRIGEARKPGPPKGKRKKTDGAESADAIIVPVYSASHDRATTGYRVTCPGSEDFLERVAFFSLADAGSWAAARTKAEKWFLICIKEDFDMIPTIRQQKLDALQDKQAGRQEALLHALVQAGAASSPSDTPATAVPPTPDSPPTPDATPTWAGLPTGPSQEGGEVEGDMI